MFSKKDRATFKYTFAHWCAYNMTALNLGIWKWKYLFHDIEKPFLKLILKDYKTVQQFHKAHNKHHVEFYLNHGYCDFEAMVIDYESSRFTKSAQPLNAMQKFQRKIMQLLDAKTSDNMIVGYYVGMQRALIKAGLWNDMEDPYNAFSDSIKQKILD